MYGITNEVREYALQKIENQKKFLDSNYFQIGNDSIAMSSVFKNAYINSDKYIAEINQRVYSLYHYANNKGLKAIFGTLTLPTEYHQYKTLKNGKVVKNSKYANKHINTIYDIKTKEPNYLNVDFKKYSPNGGAKELSRMFKNLLDLRVLRNIDKEDKCYFRVYEPHKDGTPHLHFSLFVPADKVEDIAEKLKSHFLKKYPTLKTDFQTDIHNPVAYLMKYILKTFDDLRAENSKVSDLSLWYIANKITRFYTSRTLISLEVYRKLNGRYNLLELTEMYQNRELTILLDIDTNKVVSIYDKIGNIYNKKFTEIKQVTPQTKLTYKKRIKEVPIFVDGQRYIQKNGNLIEFTPIIPVNQMNTYNLYSHYLQIDDDIENTNLHHYGLVKNELIKRNQIEGFIIPINQYSNDFMIEDFN